jgi:hypothetical protein
MDEAMLDKVTFVFSQECNTNGTTHTEGYDDYEELIVKIESVTDSLLNEAGFLVLRTPTGWSINDPKELTNLLNQVTNVLKY